MRLQHVSLAIDADGADAGRAFYGELLDLEEKPVPPKLDPEQLVWFSLGGDLELHLMQTGDAPPRLNQTSWSGSSFGGTGFSASPSSPP